MLWKYENGRSVNVFTIMFSVLQCIGSPIKVFVSKEQVFTKTLKPEVNLTSLKDLARTAQ